MNITYAQALELGGPLAEAARRAMEQGRAEPAVKGYSAHHTNVDGMNKTERRFRDEVTPHVGAIRHEPLKFRLAGRTWYAPDFVFWVSRGTTPVCVEIKGFMRDDAAVKLKVAAESYPEFRWLLVRACKGGWDVREVTDRGIGRERISVEWIPGS